MPKEKDIENEELEDKEEDEDELEEEEDNDEDDEDDRGDVHKDEDEDEPEVDDDEDAEEDKEDDEEEDEEENDTGNKADRIPKYRFNEVIEQREYEKEQRTFERERNEALRQQNDSLISLLKERENKVKEKVVEFDFASAEESYMVAVLEGEVKEAQSIRATIRKEERASFLDEAKGLRDEAVNAAKEEAGKLDDETKFTRAVKKNEESYPFLDNGSDEYNQEAVDEVNELYSVFLSAGLGKTASIQKAVDLVSPKHVKEEKPKIGDDKNAIRKKKALKKNSSAQNKQPARMKGRGARDRELDEFDVGKMSDNQFSKLSKREISELRGDSV